MEISTAGKNRPTASMASVTLSIAVKSANRKNTAAARSHTPKARARTTPRSINREGARAGRFPAGGGVWTMN